jgi:PleD family two-component response regulator
MARANELRNAIHNAVTGAYTIVIIGRTYEVAVSLAIGIAEYRPGDKHEDMVHRADADLYAAKQGVADLNTTPQHINVEPRGGIG